MAEGSCTLERDGRFSVMRFSNPPEGYMDPAMEAQFLAAVEEIEADSGVRACILTGGEEGVFIRHYEVGVLAKLGASLAARGKSFSPDRPVPESIIHKALRLMETGNTAYIAALNGTAMGGGFESALACDFRLVAEGPFEFGLPEINLGILPGAGGTQRLTRLVGVGRALEITLLGDVLTPEQLAAAGLARVCSPDNLLSEAHRIAEQLAAKPPAALAHIKRLVRGALDQPLAEGLAVERTLFCDLVIRDDARALMDDMAAGNRVITDYPDAIGTSGTD